MVFFVVCIGKVALKYQFSDSHGCLMLLSPDPDCYASMVKNDQQFKENKKKYSPAPDGDSVVNILLGSENFAVACKLTYNFACKCINQWTRWMFEEQL